MIFPFFINHISCRNPKGRGIAPCLRFLIYNLCVEEYCSSDKIHLQKLPADVIIFLCNCYNLVSAIFSVDHPEEIQWYIILFRRYAYENS